MDSWCTEGQHSDVTCAGLRNHVESRQDREQCRGYAFKGVKLMADSQEARHGDASSTYIQQRVHCGF